MSSHCGPSRRGRFVGAWNAATACPSVDCMSLCRLCRQAQRQAPRGDVTGAGESDGEHNTTPRVTLACAASSVCSVAGCAGESGGKHRAMHTSCAGVYRVKRMQRRRLCWREWRQTSCNAAGCAGMCRVKRMQRRRLRWHVPRQAYAASQVTLARATASITQRRVLRRRERRQAPCDAAGYAGVYRVKRTQRRG